MSLDRFVVSRYAENREVDVRPTCSLRSSSPRVRLRRTSLAGRWSRFRKPIGTPRSVRLPSSGALPLEGTSWLTPYPSPSSPEICRSTAAVTPFSTMPRSPSPPGPAWPSSGPTGSASRRCYWHWPGVYRSGPGAVRCHPPSGRVGLLDQMLGAIRQRDRAGARGPPDRPGRGRRRVRGGDRGAGRRWRARRSYGRPLRPRPHRLGGGRRVRLRSPPGGRPGWNSVSNRTPSIDRRPRCRVGS